MILVLLERVVGPIRLELMTSRLSSVRSNQLSYGPIGHTDQPDQRGQNRSWARDRLDNLAVIKEWKEKRRRRRSAHCI